MRNTGKSDVDVSCNTSWDICWHVRSENVQSIAAGMKACKANKTACLLCIVQGIDRVPTRKGSKIAMLRITDETCLQSEVVFWEAEEKLRPLEENDVVQIDGTDKEKKVNHNRFCFCCFLDKHRR